MSSDDIDIGKEFIERKTVSDMLGVTISGLRRLEQRGVIRAVRQNKQGHWQYSRAQVSALAASRAIPGSMDGAPGLTRKSAEPYTPEEAGRVFEALDNGKTLIQCVKECGVMPLAVEALAVVHARMSGFLFVGKESLDIINQLPLEGTFPLQGEQDLVDVLKKAASDVCKSCNTRARVFCKGCAIKAARKALESEPA